MVTIDGFVSRTHELYQAPTFPALHPLRLYPSRIIIRDFIYKSLNSLSRFIFVSTLAEPLPVARLHLMAILVSRFPTGKLLASSLVQSPWWELTLTDTTPAFATCRRETPNHPSPAALHSPPAQSQLEIKPGFSQKLTRALDCAYGKATTRVFSSQQ